MAFVTNWFQYVGVGTVTANAATTATVTTTITGGMLQGLQGGQLTALGNGTGIAGALLQQQVQQMGYQQGLQQQHGVCPCPGCNPLVPAADKRAHDLLWSFLTPTQRDSAEKKGWTAVYGG